MFVDERAAEETAMLASNRFRSPALLAAAVFAASIGCNAVPERESLGNDVTPNASVQVVVRGSTITPIFVSRAQSGADPSVPHAPVGRARRCAGSSGIRARTSLTAAWRWIRA